MGTLWLAELFGLTPDCFAVWASAGRDANKSAHTAATLSSIANNFILFSPVCSADRHDRPSGAATDPNRQTSFMINVLRNSVERSLRSRRGPSATSIFRRPLLGMRENPVKDAHGSASIATTPERLKNQLDENEPALPVKFQLRNSFQWKKAAGLAPMPRDLENND